MPLIDVVLRVVWELTALVKLAAAVACLVLLVIISQPRNDSTIAEEQVVFVRPRMMERQRRVIRMPRTQSLDVDFLPEAYDASFATEPESYDGMLP